MIRDGYKEDKRKLTGGYNGGTTTIWRITAPSGNTYEVSKNSNNRIVYITDKDDFKVIAIKESYRLALSQIYDWEDNSINVLPDLTKEKDIKDILNSYHGIIYASTLIENECIESNLQTAVYLFHSHYCDVKDTRHNLANLNSIFRNMDLSDEESIALCKYAISKDPNCAESFPSDLIVKMTKAGKAGELFTPDETVIDPAWFNNPSYGEKVNQLPTKDMEEDEMEL